MSSTSTLFIALQCCQCSTMQVKQKKKSSNKWNCAVCNQKQSVRKIFAQGFMAKDLRKFVQDFNMSRKSFDDGQWPLAGTLDPALDHIHGEVDHTNMTNDWSPLLEQEDHHALKEQQEDVEGDDFEPLVVTELQKGMFKKRRVMEDSTSGNDKLFKKPLMHNSQDKQRTQKCKTSSKIASKRNDYLSEDNDNLEVGWKRDFNLEDHSGLGNNIVLEVMTSERVEDDIHPDFM